MDITLKRNNLSKKELEKLQEIANSREIVIVPASIMLSMVRELKVLRFKANTAAAKIGRLKGELRKASGNNGSKN